MPKEALTITLEAERRADLDRMDETQGRDRDTVIEEAIANWQRRQYRHFMSIRNFRRMVHEDDRQGHACAPPALGRRRLSRPLTGLVEGLAALFSNHIPDYRNLINSHTALTRTRG